MSGTIELREGMKSVGIIRCWKEGAASRIPSDKEPLPEFVDVVQGWKRGRLVIAHFSYGLPIEKAHGRAGDAGFNFK